MTILGLNVDPKLAEQLQARGWNSDRVHTAALFLPALWRLGYRPGDLVRRFFAECSGRRLRAGVPAYDTRFGATRYSNLRWAAVLLLGRYVSLFPPARLTWPISVSLLSERCTPIGHSGELFPLFMTESGKVLSFDIEYSLLNIYPSLVAFLDNRVMAPTSEREIFWAEDGEEGGVLDPDVNVALFERLSRSYGR